MASATLICCCRLCWQNNKAYALKFNWATAAGGKFLSAQTAETLNNLLEYC